MSEALSDFYKSVVQQGLTSVRHEDNMDTGQLDIALTPVYAAACESRLNWKNSGVKAKNFVYGEVNMIDIYNIIAHFVDIGHPTNPSTSNIQPKANPTKFVSLGCGAGPCMAAALFSGKFQYIEGIDLMKSKIRECEHTFSTLSSKSQYLSSLLNFDVKLRLLGFDNSKEHMIATTPDTESATNIRIVYGNFLDAVSCNANNGDLGGGWTDADVVYCCATCFTVDILQGIVVMCQNLRKGSYVILIDSEALISQPVLTYSPMPKRNCTEMVYERNPEDTTSSSRSHPQSSQSSFIKANSHSISSSWGPCTAHMFKKVT